MTEEPAKNQDSPSSRLCKRCGLCCTGHLFIAAVLYPGEVEQARALELHVVQSNAGEPAFSLGCPLWNGQCSIYTHPHRPSICGRFKCKLLREVEDGQLELDDALITVEKTKQIIQELDVELQATTVTNFRQRIAKQVSRLKEATSPTEAERAFRLRVGVLMVLFSQRFGVKDLFNRSEQGNPPRES